MLYDKLSRFLKEKKIVIGFEENRLPVVTAVIDVIQFVFEEIHSERYAILRKYGIPATPHLTNIYL